MGSRRWCPTPEQVMILEEMYRSGGIKTPSATQIQQITAHLSAYGKIEGKNVFYWFQNHKARDRQKLRRKLMLIHQQQLLNYKNYHFLPSPHPYYHPLHHQLSHYNSAQLLGGVEDAPTKQMNYTWKVDLPERLSQTDHKSMNRMCGHDWMLRMTMMDVGPTISCCKRPLETLELFPMKDQCNKP